MNGWRGSNREVHLANPSPWHKVNRERMRLCTWLQTIPGALGQNQILSIAPRMWVHSLRCIPQSRRLFDLQLRLLHKITVMGGSPQVHARAEGFPLPREALRPLNNRRTKPRDSSLYSLHGKQSCVDSATRRDHILRFNHGSVKKVLVSKKNTGAAKQSESIRSSTPPCPTTSVP